MTLDIRAHNRAAWDRQVAKGNRWTLPVTPAQVNEARQGRVRIVLTPCKLVPAKWFPPLAGTSVLCLAAAGGQQAPLLAAAGASVTVLDNSPAQLEQDRLVACRDGLQLTTVEGDMRRLPFRDGSFELIVHPVANCFVPDVLPVWRECSRVLKCGGQLLAGFTNPLRYLFDDERTMNGRLEVKHVIPYSDLVHLTVKERQEIVLGPMQPLEFGHTLADQIGGQLAAGLVLTGFYEDRCSPDEPDQLSRFIDTFIATRAVKPGQDACEAPAATGESRGT